MHLIADGLGDKLSTAMQWLMTFCTAYVISFILGWKLALATVGICPVVIFLGGIITRVSIHGNSIITHVSILSSSYTSLTVINPVHLIH